MNPLETINQIMTRDVIAVQQDAPLSTVRRILGTRPIHHVPVLNGEVLVGILSSADIARLALDAYVVDDDTVSSHLDAAFSILDVMTPEPLALTPSDAIRRAAEILGDGHFHSLPIVDEQGRLVGMVTSTDLIRYLVGQYH